MILLAEEESSTILEVEKMLRVAFKFAEQMFKKSQQLQYQGSTYEALHR